MCRDGEHGPVSGAGPVGVTVALAKPLVKFVGPLSTTVAFALVTTQSIARMTVAYVPDPSSPNALMDMIRASGATPKYMPLLSLRLLAMRLVT